MIRFQSRAQPRDGSRGTKDDLLVAVDTVQTAMLTLLNLSAASDSAPQGTANPPQTPFIPLQQN